MRIPSKACAWQSSRAESAIRVDGQDRRGDLVLLSGWFDGACRVAGSCK